MLGADCCEASCVPFGFFLLLLLLLLGLALLLLIWLRFPPSARVLSLLVLPAENTLFFLDNQSICKGVSLVRKARALPKSDSVERNLVS